MPCFIIRRCVLEKYQIIYEELKKRDDFLIVSHFSPDGDNIGSSVAIYHFLKSIGKKAVILNEDKCPDKFRFLIENVDFYQVENYSNTQKFKNIIILDAGDIKRVGETQSFFADEIFVINIDHHISNNGFGNISIVKPDFSSTGEVIYTLFEKNNFDVTKDIATAIYAAILSDTGGFRYSNTTPKTLSIAAKLAKNNISPSDLMERIFHSNTYNQIIRLGNIIEKTELIKEASIVSLYHDETKESIEDNDLVLELLNSIKEAKITLFIRKIKENFIKISFRANCNFNVSEFASRFGGGGHPKAAGLRFEGSYDDVKNTIINKLIIEMKDFLKKNK